MSPDSSPAIELRRSLAIATEKVESIIAEAESAAAQIRADAQATADEYRDRRIREVDSGLGARSQKLDSMIAPLLQRVKALHAQTQELADEFDATSAQMRVGGTPVVPAAGVASAEPAERPAVVEPRAEEPVATGKLRHEEPPDQGPLVEPDPRRQFAGSGGPSGPSPVAYPGVVPAAGHSAAAEDAQVEYSPEDALLRATQLAVSGSSRPEIAKALQAEFKIDDVELVLDGILGPEPR